MNNDDIILPFEYTELVPEMRYNVFVYYSETDWKRHTPTSILRNIHAEAAEQVVVEARAHDHIAVAFPVDDTPDISLIAKFRPLDRKVVEKVEAELVEDFAPKDLIDRVVLSKCIGEGLVPHSEMKEALSKVPKYNRPKKYIRTRKRVR